MEITKENVFVHPDLLKMPRSLPHKFVVLEVDRGLLYLAAPYVGDSGHPREKYDESQFGERVESHFMIPGRFHNLNEWIESLPDPSSDKDKYDSFLHSRTIGGGQVEAGDGCMYFHGESEAYAGVPPEIMDLFREQLAKCRCYTIGPEDLDFETGCTLRETPGPYREESTLEEYLKAHDLQLKQ